MIATLTSKGQVTLPKQIRNRLRLHAGDKLDFFVKDDRNIEIIPLKEPPQQLRGMLGKSVRSVSIDEMNTAIKAGVAGSDRS